jgi:hypothetical protein
MKKLAIIALSVLAVSCNKYKISGEIKGMPDGTMVYLEKQGESTATGIIGVDTAVVKDGKFMFEGKTEEPLMHRVRFDQLGGFMLILEKGNIEAKANKDSLNFGIAKVTGTRSNDELAAYNKTITAITKKMRAFETQNIQALQTAEAAKDTATVERLRKEYMKFNEEIIASNKAYAEKNTDSFLSVLIIQGMFADPNVDVAKVKKYFDNLSSDLKETSTAKKVKKQIEDFEKATQAASKKKLS